MCKKLSEITRDEWIKTWWYDVTLHSDMERMFVHGYERTPDEAAQAMRDWDETAKERGKVL